ncbi:MAG: hypothetical protein HMLKMBBP_01021 [Planctomycetes bacterium]|nr:hypothetical protein [Planctomycetota bacterium]
MTRLAALTRRELLAYFYAPVPYFILCLFVLLTGNFFYSGAVVHGSSTRASLEPGVVFHTLQFILLFLIPLLTMNSVADERSRNTIETLLTAPVTDAQVILSKWTGTFLFYLVMLVPTLVYVGILRQYGAEIGKPDLEPVLGAYAGCLLLGGFYISIGVFASSITENALLSAFLAFVILIGLLVLEIFRSTVADIGGVFGDALRGAVEYLPQTGHFNEFLTGKVALHDVLYFVLGTALFLFLAVRSLESRKWR